MASACRAWRLNTLSANTSHPNIPTLVLIPNSSCLTRLIWLPSAITRLRSPRSSLARFQIQPAGESGCFSLQEACRAGGTSLECLPMLKHIRWNDVELEKLNPLLDRQMITGENLMLARVLLKKGCVVPEHSHLNEQLTYIVEGALKFWIDGKEIIVRAGEVLCIPPHMPHKAEAVEDTVDIDVFYPPRQDWLSKSDAYLRNAEPATSR